MAENIKIKDMEREISDLKKAVENEQKQKHEANEEQEGQDQMEEVDETIFLLDLEM